MSTSPVKITWIGLVMLALLWGLAGCGGNAQPIVVSLPSPTATFFSPTAIPSVTQAATLPVVSSTPAPTQQPPTLTPGPSPTSPLAPTLSPAPQVLTATRVPTLAGLVVEYFTTDTEYVKPGDNVTLYWSVRGADRARIFRVNADGERIYRWDVATTGQVTVATRAADRDVARFVLVGELAGSSVEQELFIPLQCPEVWFFDPAPAACPGESPQVSRQVEQVFERGRMIWVEAQHRIYVVFEDGNSPQWAQYPDEFKEGDPERDDTLVPPPGLEQPVRGFGLVWRSNLRVQERLGWATSPEIPYEGMYQADAVELSVATLYLRMADGGILGLNAQADTWEIIPPPPIEASTPAP